MTWSGIININTRRINPFVLEVDIESAVGTTDLVTSEFIPLVAGMPSALNAKSVEYDMLNSQREQLSE